MTDIKMSNTFDLPVSDGDFTLVAMNKSTYVSMDRAAVIAINSYDLNQERIAELEKECNKLKCKLSHSETMGELEQAKRDLEQQARGVDWVLACRELNLSEGEVHTLMDKCNGLCNQAKALKEHGNG